jgi:hypothetical protein
MKKKCVEVREDIGVFQRREARGIDEDIRILG